MLIVIDFLSFVRMVFYVVVEARMVESKLGLIWCLRVGLKIFPVGQRSVIAAMSKRVGVTIPHDKWKMLVEDSQKIDSGYKHVGVILGSSLQQLN